MLKKQISSLKAVAVLGAAALGVSAVADAPAVDGEVTGVARQVVERIEVLEQLIVTSDKPRVEVVDEVVIESILDDVEAIEAETETGAE